jgi:hypothetical protein
VSGAPEGATDEECAQKGVDAVAGDLELADSGSLSDNHVYG